MSEVRTGTNLPALAGARPQTQRSPGYTRRAWQRLRRDKLAMIALVLLVTIVGLAFAIAPDQPGTAYAVTSKELNAALASPRQMTGASTGPCLRDG